MAYGISPQQRIQRRERLRRVYPELETADEGMIGKVDLIRRAEGRPLTSYGQAAEDAYIQLQAEGIEDYAPNRTGYEPGALSSAIGRSGGGGFDNPYSDASLTAPYEGPSESFQRGQRQTSLRDIGRALEKPAAFLGYQPAPSLEARSAAERDFRPGVSDEDLYRAYEVAGGVIGQGLKLGPDDIKNLVARKTSEGMTPQQAMRDPEVQEAMAQVFAPDRNITPSRPASAADIGKNLQRARTAEARAAELGLSPEPPKREVVPTRPTRHLPLVTGQGQLAMDLSYLANAEQRLAEAADDYARETAEASVKAITDRIRRGITPELAARVRNNLNADIERWQAGLSGDVGYMPGQPLSAATDARVADAYQRQLRLLDELTPIDTTARPTPEKLPPPRAESAPSQADEAFSKFRPMADDFPPANVSPITQAGRDQIAKARAKALGLSEEPPKDYKGDTLSVRIVPPNPFPMIREALAGAGKQMVGDSPMFPGMEPPRVGRSANEITQDVLNFPMTAQSTYDASAPGRQLAPMLYAHPTRIIPALRAQYGNFRTSTFEAAQQRLRNKPYARFRDEIAKVELADLGSDLAKREEQLGSSIAEKVLPYSKNFNQGYTMAINEARDWLFEKMFREIDPALLTEAGLRNGGRQELERIGGLINASSGRGSDLGGRLAQNKIAGIPAFWAPRLLVGRVQLVTSMASPSPAVRKEAARQVLAFVGVNSALLALIKESGVADVELDPRSSDFGQIRIGQRRFDVWAGYRPIANLVARLGFGLAGEDNMKTVDGDIYSKSNIAVIGRFLRSKESPVFGELTSQVFDRDMAGNKPSESPGGRLGHAAYQLAVPSLFLKSLVEEMMETVPKGFESGGRAGAAKEAAISIGSNVPAFHGTGGGYYEDDDSAPARKATVRPTGPPRPKRPDRPTRPTR